MPDLTPTDQNNGSTTLFARWTPITYYVYYYANGGSGTMNYTTHTYGTSFNLPTNIFKMTGYDFSGWATSTSGNVAYTDGQLVQDLATEQSKSVKLYAVWQAKKYKIIYKNLADGMRVSPNYYYYDQGMSTMPLIWIGEQSNTTTVKPFYGWYNSAKFTNPITFIPKDQIGDITLYAKYDYFLTTISCVETYTVTDAGVGKNPSFSMAINLNRTHYDKVNGTTLNKIRIELSLDLWEVDDGYQHIYIWNNNYTKLMEATIWSKKIDHSGGKKTYKYTIEFDLEKYKDVDALTFMFDASGAFSDTWKFENFTAQAYLVN